MICPSPYTRILASIKVLFISRFSSEIPQILRNDSLCIVLRFWRTNEALELFYYNKAELTKTHLNKYEDVQDNNGKRGLTKLRSSSFKLTNTNYYFIDFYFTRSECIILLLQSRCLTRKSVSNRSERARLKKNNPVNLVYLLPSTLPLSSSHKPQTALTKMSCSQDYQSYKTQSMSFHLNSVYLNRLLAHSGDKIANLKLKFSS